MANEQQRHDMSDEVWNLLKPHLPGQRGQWGGVAKDKCFLASETLARNCHSIRQKYGFIPCCCSNCYITSKDGSELKLLLSSGIALYIVAGLLAIIIIFLIVELIIHLAILFHQQKNSAKSSDSTACAKTTGAKNFFSDDSLDYMDLYMYRHGENDILFRLPDRKS